MILMKADVFWDVAPCNLVKVYQLCRARSSLHCCQIMWSHIPEDSIAHSQCSENLRCHNHDDSCQNCMLQA